MDASGQLAAYLKAHPGNVGKVIDYNSATDRLYHFDFSAANTELSVDTFSDTQIFDRWVTEKLNSTHSLYGVGGYMEHRIIYSRSSHFDTDNEPRRLHLGVDIWGKNGTVVYSPLQGKVHSFNNNDNFGDYGPTIILEHNLRGLQLYTLYGHLSRKSLDVLRVGQNILMDQKIASFGNRNENGHWPPHLHFQLMFDMEGRYGDYPGVCRYSEKDKYLKNIPNPQLILQFINETTNQ